CRGRRRGRAARGALRVPRRRSRVHERRPRAAAAPRPGDDGVGRARAVARGDRAGIRCGAADRAAGRRRAVRGLREAAMTGSAALPVLVLLSSLVPGLIIFGLPESSRRARTALNLAGAVLKVLLVALIALGIADGVVYAARLPLVGTIDLVLVVDPLGILLMVLSAILWLITTVYAVGYLEASPHRSRFFGFFSICVTATVGVAMAGNLVTFLVFYELNRKSTYPLVVHRGTETARRAGRIYLFYTLTGGTLLLAGTAWLHSVAGDTTFTERGFLLGLP